MAVSSGKKGTVPRLLLLLQMCREAYVGLGPSDYALVYDGMADGYRILGLVRCAYPKNEEGDLFVRPLLGLPAFVPPLLHSLLLA